MQVDEKLVGKRYKIGIRSTRLSGALIKTGVQGSQGDFNRGGLDETESGKV